MQEEDVVWAVFGPAFPLGSSPVGLGRLRTRISRFAVDRPHPWPWPDFNGQQAHSVLLAKLVDDLTVRASYSR